MVTPPASRCTDKSCVCLSYLHRSQLLTNLFVLRCARMHCRRCWGFNVVLCRCRLFYKLIPIAIQTQLYKWQPKKSVVDMRPIYGQYSASILRKQPIVAEYWHANILTVFCEYSTETPYISAILVREYLRQTPVSLGGARSGSYGSICTR
jgi:hypothetical protein